jgi:hypothetical protein
MIYKIEKYLGNVSAVLVDTFQTLGICVEIKNYAQRNASIVVYRNGSPSDLYFNGWPLPCVYNKMNIRLGGDIYGGDYKHTISFDLLDKDSTVQSVTDKKIYGSKESLMVEYFYSLLYNLSCCKDIEQIYH